MNYVGSGKSWIAQEYYNEYLELKENLLFASSRHSSQEEIASLAERLRCVIGELKRAGVDPADLILLSAGVPVDLFGQKERERAKIRSMLRKGD